MSETDIIPLRIWFLRLPQKSGRLNPPEGQHVRRTWYNQDTDHIRERRNTMKVIDALFRLSKFFWVPLTWAAVISVFLFCVGRQRLIFWALYLGLILTAVLGIVYLVGEFTRNQDQ